MANESYVPRENLQRTLSYRPHLKILYFLLNLFSILLLAVIAFDIGSKIYFGYRDFDTVFVLFVFFLAAVFLIEAHFFLKPMAYTTVQVKPDRVTLKDPKKTIEILFADAKETHVHFLPYLGGWFEIKMSDGKVYKFTVVLERSEYILESIASYRSELVLPDNIANYRRTAITADHSWARLYDALKNYKKLWIKLMIPPILATLLTSFTGSQNLGAWTHKFMIFMGINIGLGVLAWMIAETVLTIQTRKSLLENPNFPRRNMPHETHVFKVAAWSYYTAFVFVTFFIFRNYLM